MPDKRDHGTKKSATNESSDIKQTNSGISYNPTLNKLNEIENQSNYILDGGPTTGSIVKGIIGSNNLANMPIKNDKYVIRDNFNKGKLKKRMVSIH